jgi:ABC-2 type transport system permease protein
MKRTFVLMRKDLKEALSSKNTYFYFLILIFIAFPYFEAAKGVLDSLIQSDPSKAIIRESSQALVSGMFFTLPLVMVMLVCSVFAAYAVIMDKTKRSIESLLATPLSLRQVWMAKSLAVTIPSITIGVGISILLIILLNIMVFMPVVGVIIPDISSLIGGIILIPLLTFFVVSIVTFLQLIMTNPRLASLAFSAIFIGIYLSTITEVTRNWDFSLIYLMIIALLVLINIFLSRFLTKEKIILSSKG